MKIKSMFASLAVLGAVLVSANAPTLAGNGWHQNREQRFDNNHPRRSEVLDRSNNLNRRINNNKGNLDGHYGQLKQADRNIRKQEQRMAHRNGGYITQGQQAKINKEENHLNNQIKRDH